MQRSRSVGVVHPALGDGLAPFIGVGAGAHGLSDRSSGWSSHSLQLTQAASSSASSDVCYLHR